MGRRKGSGIGKGLLAAAAGFGVAQSSQPVLAVPLPPLVIPLAVTWGADDEDIQALPQAESVPMGAEEAVELKRRTRRVRALLSGVPNGASTKGAKPSQPIPDRPHRTSPLRAVEAAPQIDEER